MKEHRRAPRNASHECDGDAARIAAIGVARTLPELLTRGGCERRRQATTVEKKTTDEDEEEEGEKGS